MKFGPSPLARPAAPAGFEPVVRCGELVDGMLLAVRAPDGENVCLARSGSSVYAVSDRCTHQGFAISKGELCGGDGVECVWHGARFNLATGRATRGPATGSLATYEVLEVDDWVCIGPRRERSNGQLPLKT